MLDLTRSDCVLLQVSTTACRPVNHVRGFLSVQYRTRKSLNVLARATARYTYLTERSVRRVDSRNVVTSGCGWKVWSASCVSGGNNSIEIMRMTCVCVCSPTLHS